MRKIPRRVQQVSSTLGFNTVISTHKTISKQHSHIYACDNITTDKESEIKMKERNDRNKERMQSAFNKRKKEKINKNGINHDEIAHLINDLTL